MGGYGSGRLAKGRETNHFSRADREEMCRLRLAGASLLEIAKKFCTSKQLVSFYTPKLPLDIQQEIIERRRREVFAARSDLWTNEDGRILTECWKWWRSSAAIASSGRLKRSVSAIKCRVYHLGLRERLIDEPRGAPITLPKLKFLEAPSHFEDSLSLRSALSHPFSRGG